MNEKVTEKWFEENGWTPSIFYLNNTIDGRGRVTTERIITYMLNNGSTTLKGYSQARWDHTIRVTRDKRGKVVGEVTGIVFRYPERDFILKIGLRIAGLVSSRWSLLLK